MNKLIVLALVFMSGCVSLRDYEVCQSNLNQANETITTLRPTEEEIAYEERRASETVRVVEVVQAWAAKLRSLLEENVGEPATIYLHSIGFAGDFDGVIVGIIAECGIFGGSFFLIMVKDENGEWADPIVKFPPLNGIPAEEEEFTL